MMIGHSPLMHDHSEMMPSNVTSADLMWWVATQGGMVEESDVLADGGFAYGNFPIFTDDSNVQHDASFAMSTHTEDGVLPNAGSSIPTRTQDRMFRDHDATSGSNSSSIPHNPSAHITSRSYRLSLVLLPGMDVEGSDEVRLDITNGGYYTMQQFHLHCHGAVHSHDNDKGMYVVQWDYPFKSSDHIKVILYVPVCSCFPNMFAVDLGEISVPCRGA